MRCILSVLESQQSEDNTVVDMGTCENYEFVTNGFLISRNLPKKPGKIEEGNGYRRVQSRPTLLMGCQYNLSNPGTSEVSSTEISSIKKFKIFGLSFYPKEPSFGFLFSV